MEVTLGGDRLGSGNTRKQEMHNYNRASFNQEQDLKTSMAPGVLYPFLCIPMTNGDSMDIDLDTFVRTLPTKGPLFGSFKFQLDLFSIPMRLYNGILHNNPLKIGMNMKQIYMPKLNLHFDALSPRVKGSTDKDWQINPSSLLKYLGISGIGNLKSKNQDGYRKINAIPILGYYDIFKNYYANKQEKYAYVIVPDHIELKNVEIAAAWVNYNNYPNSFAKEEYLEFPAFVGSNDETPAEIYLYTNSDLNEIEATDLITQIELYSAGTSVISLNEVSEGSKTKEYNENGWYIGQLGTQKRWKWRIGVKINSTSWATAFENQTTFLIGQPEDTQEDLLSSDIKLQPFELDNIDHMREDIFKHTELGYEYVINNFNAISGWGAESNYPYQALWKTEQGANYNSFIMNGLCVKTYQSDLFNNWIDTEWIEGENGVGALSAVNVSEGTLEMDALLLAQKVYNMLNRVALSGGTYEDWQEAVYTQEAVRKAETPIYEGGMSAEIMFEEVIANSASEADGDFQALGSLGGKGTQVGSKGGKNIHIRAKEPVFVMGIASLTPRICYSQGNEWYLTELDTFDDLHKPALDGIGFQDLITEQMAWWGSRIIDDEDDNPVIVKKNSAGKVVAWSNYMTAVDKAAGDFAKADGVGFMVLDRNYEMDNNGDLSDVTTYIDPAKFNYAFAYTDLAAQNFWVQIHSKVTTRRVMSAHQIPNL